MDRLRIMASTKKYRLLEPAVDGLHRIQALKDFGNVKTGDVGGWIESESNLSHDGLCWVFDDAKVSDNAKVYGDAKVFDNAKVSGDAMVYGNAMGLW